MVGNVTLRRDTLVEGVEYVEGFRRQGRSVALGLHIFLHRVILMQVRGVLNDLR